MLTKSPIIWSLVSTLLRAGGVLLTLPIALRVIPEAEIGLYYTFLSITSLALLLDMGFAQTLVRFSSHAWAGAKNFRERGVPNKPESNEPNLSLLMELMVVARFWHFLLGVVIAFILILPGGYFIKIEIQEAGLNLDLIFCWIAMSIAVGLSFSFEFWRSVLFGIGGLRESQQVTIVAQLGSVFVTGLALIYGFGLWSFPIARVVLAVLNRYTAKLFLVRMVNIKINNWPNDGTLIKTMWPMAWRQGIIAIGEFLVLRAGVIVCASLFGLKATASYGLALQVLGVLAAICSAPLAVAIPLISEFRIQCKTKKIVNMFFMRTYIGLIVFLILGVLVSFIAPSFLTYIASNVELLEPNLFFLLIVVQALNFHQNSWTSLVLTENNNPFVMPVILTGICAVCASWFFGAKFGIVGMIIGQAVVPLVFMNWWVVWRGCKGLSLPITENTRRLNSPGSK